jgi:hypothetical protein
MNMKEWELEPTARLKDSAAHVLGINAVVHVPTMLRFCYYSTPLSTVAADSSMAHT